MKVAPKFTAAATSSSMASGQIERVCVTMTLSTMSRWISGMTAVTAVASSAPAKARTKLRR